MQHQLRSFPVISRAVVVPIFSIATVAGVRRVIKQALRSICYHYFWQFKFQKHKRKSFVIYNEPISQFPSVLFNGRRSYVFGDSSFLSILPTHAYIKFVQYHYRHRVTFQCPELSPRRGSSTFTPPTLPPPTASGCSWAPERGHFVEHVAHDSGGVPVPAPARGARDVPAEEVLAGVPPELLPFKKRVVRYHPYAAAAAIQELASHRDRGGGGGTGGGGFLLAAEPPTPPGAPLDLDEDDGLRAELLRLRITRPALVLTKQLTASDRSRDKARLVLPDGLVRPSPLLGMLTAAERRLVLGAGLPVPAFDRLGRAYRMSLRRDPSAHTCRLTGQWSLFVSRHDTRAGDAVEVRAFRPSAWQARLDRHGEGGLGMALVHRRQAGIIDRWCNRERDAADGLLLLMAATSAIPVGA